MAWILDAAARKSSSSEGGKGAASGPTSSGGRPYDGEKGADIAGKAMPEGERAPDRGETAEASADDDGDEAEEAGEGDVTA